MVTFRMEADIKFTRPIIDTDSVSTGSYEITMGNKIFHIDFEDSESYIDKKDSTILHIEYKNPDESTFPDMKDITEELLGHISDVSEVYIDVYSVAEDLDPVGITSLSFTLPYDHWKEIVVPGSTYSKTQFVM